MAPFHHELSKGLEAGESLEQAHNAKTNPAETRYHSVNEATEQVLELVTVQWEGAITKTTPKAARASGKGMDKGVKKGVKALLGQEAAESMEAEEARAAPGRGSGGPPMVPHSAHLVRTRSAIAHCSAASLFGGLRLEYNDIVELVEVRGTPEDLMQLPSSHRHVGALFEMCAWVLASGWEAA